MLKKYDLHYFENHKKSKIKFCYSIVAAGLYILLATGCEKETEDAQVPVVTTDAISNILLASAICRGTVTSDGGFEVTTRGICWSTQNPPSLEDNVSEEGTGLGSFLSYIMDLNPSTTYYAAAYATNNNGTGYGAVVSFNTEQGATDVDGNLYKSISMGSQTWMGSNLATTKYNDGTPIPYHSTYLTWRELDTPGYTAYFGDPSYISAYGALYNWYTVDSEKLCPEGWRIPTDEEWTILASYLGSTSLAGGRLKQAGEISWRSPNTGATNEFGFTALPGGYCNIDGEYSSLGSSGFWWSSTEASPTAAWARGMSHASSTVTRGDDNKKRGFSVRCIKD